MVKETELLDTQSLAGLIALDVATHYTGYAYFKPIAKEGNSLIFYLKRYGNIKGREKELDFRCLEINSVVRSLIMELSPTELVMEFPAYQGGSKGNNASRQGDTIKLAYLCGKIACGWELYIAEMMKHGLRLNLAKRFTPQQWKGQTTKSITQNRCKKKYGLELEKKVDDNWIDAIMMGDWYITNNDHTVTVDSKWERVDY